jgi:hypothetical protein
MWLQKLKKNERWEGILFLRRDWLFVVGGICLDAGGRRMRNRGGEGRWFGHILTIIDGITGRIYPLVYPSATLSMK